LDLRFVDNVHLMFPPTPPTWCVYNIYYPLYQYISLPEDCFFLPCGITVVFNISHISFLNLVNWTGSHKARVHFMYYHLLNYFAWWWPLSGVETSRIHWFNNLINLTYCCVWWSFIPPFSYLSCGPVILGV
jgi:hypothetical protein